MNRQREQYRLLKSGKKSFIKNERIVQLENVGFKWETKSATQQKCVLKPSLVSRSSSNKVDTQRDLRTIPKCHIYVLV